MILNSHLRGPSNIIEHDNSLSIKNPWRGAAIMSSSYGNFEILRKAIDIFSRAIKKNSHSTLHIT